ncbi:histidine--tRNA ligase [Novispirillum itersonii]|uniref:Histidine--tRNA ligase n=1 Tax=Novispirillum itersonii TaxID=189 RepID=A0A7W9ZED5_NOVIT|nr:histidine--tRNA ligase [Novispirillum itersonii]MBB6209966.1 histidyl-tRNA synthetase [Novispirillum itersonii]
MASLQPVRGTHDLLFEDMRRHHAVIERAKGIAGLYGFEEVITPIFEFTEVFTRTIGETSDIVSKEMYAFERSGDQLCLRPEGTAGVCRAFVSNGLQQQVPFKAFYAGPMFRYERPQKGRQRQFHQIGVELIGADTPKADVEVLVLASHILDALGLKGQVTLELNTLGDTASRAAYRDRLVEFLTPYRNDLSDDSKVRLDKNPLRILDSKDEGDRRLIAEAPKMEESLNAESRAFFETVQAGLTAHGISYVVNPKLVRGLDYYCHTAFEFVTTALGAQGTVLAGGRYDGLIEAMGGPSTPGVGWAGGIERLALLLADVPGKARPIAVIPMGDAAEGEADAITGRLRRAGYAVDLAYSGNMKKRMKRANTVNARVAVILGEDELKQGAAAVRDLDSGEQVLVPLAALETDLARFR